MARPVRLERVRIEAVSHVLPEEVVPSEALEERLGAVYDRLRLRAGRLELMTGIRERRLWPPGTRPSEAAARAGELALARGGVSRERVGCLVHASVSRDQLEPSTASAVHRALGLAPACQAFDVSNACLGVLNGMVVAGGMLEQGWIDAALVVAGEDARPLLDETIRDALAREDLDRETFKGAFASLTIGSGAAAVLLAREGVATSEHRLVGGVALADTDALELCTGDRPEGLAGPLMTTDSEALLEAGNALAARTFERLLAELGWTREELDRVVTHQVGSAHRRLLLETLGLGGDRDLPTYAELGNTGSAALPTALSLAVERGFVAPGHTVGLLGIGSGLHCLMLGAAW